MFSSGPNYTKLKTHLRLSVNRLKLLEKKKTELAQKSRKEIADYLGAGKVERAKIRVEHIIREDYLVEAMEIVEMFCDLLLARFGLLTQMKELDAGIAEPVSSLIWVAPRLQADVAELKVIGEILASKYGKPFAECARTASGQHWVSDKLMHKLAVQAPPRLLVEKYLIEIASIYHIDYEPDVQIMNGGDGGADGGDEGGQGGAPLIDLTDRNNLGGGAGAFAYPPVPVGFVVQPPMPMPSSVNRAPFQYPNAPAAGGQVPPSAPLSTSPYNYNIMPGEQPAASGGDETKDLNINASFLSSEKQPNMPPAYNSSAVSPDDNLHRAHPQAPCAISNQSPPSYSVATNSHRIAGGSSSAAAAANSPQQQNLNKPKPQPRSKMPTDGEPNGLPAAPIGFPTLPSVPTDLPDPDGGAVGEQRDDEIDFDDLARRFEELTKKK